MLVECTAPVEFHGQLLSSVTRRNGLIIESDVSEAHARVLSEVSSCILGFIIGFEVYP